MLHQCWRLLYTSHWHLRLKYPHCLLVLRLKRTRVVRSWGASVPLHREVTFTCYTGFVAISDEFTISDRNMMGVYQIFLCSSISERAGKLLIGLSCERPLWCPMWNPALTKRCKFGWQTGGGSIIFWPCACSNFKKKIIGKILVCHTFGGWIIFWPCTCWIFKKNSRWDPGLSYLGGSIIFWPCACWIFKKILDEILVFHMGILNFLKIQHAYGQKMIDPPPGMTDQDLL